MGRTIDSLVRRTREAGIEQPSFYNFAVTDGRTVIATRFSDRATDDPPSLYVSTGFEPASV